MSADTNHGHGAAHGHDDHGHHEAAHGSFKTYMTGFILSVILTAIPFYLVMTHALGSNQLTATVVVAFAFVQVIVHMVCFLHMDTKSEGGWTIMALIFTIMVLVITLSGSLWVMYHMNANMAPVSVHDMSQMP